MPYIQTVVHVQRGEGGSELPWAFREPADAEELLRAAAAGGLPQRRVERLALLHLLMRLHREAHARSGAAPKPVFPLSQTFLSQAGHQTRSFLYPMPHDKGWGCPQYVNCC